MENKTANHSIIVNRNTTLKEMFNYGTVVNLYNEFYYYNLPFWFEKQKDGTTYYAFLGDKIPKHLKEFLEEEPLSKQYIESLGWIYDNNAEPIPARKDIPFELPLAFVFDTQMENGKCFILYKFSDGTVWIDYILNSGGEGYIFKGTIKNKSELQQIMKMVGIITTTSGG